jgi:hypothetical protein
MSSFQIRTAERRKAKIRLGLSSVSGGGKTYSALHIAKGMVGAWEKVFVIDTENNSADLYAHFGPYKVVPFHAPYSPERYIEAIKACEDAGAEIIILDSYSHAWEGEGGALQIADQLGGQYQTAWKQVTPRYEALKNKILQSKCHIITTTRRKQDYDMGKDQNGKTKVQKVGLKEVTREGWEYDLTANLELDTTHHATASKDRTGLFMGKPAFVPSEATGEAIALWCEQGEEEPKPSSDWTEKVNKCKDQKELVALYQKNKAEVDSNPLLQQLIANRRNQINSKTITANN